MPPLTIPHLFTVTNLIVVITGGGSGLGAYAAKALALNGAKAVYIIGRRAEPLRKTAEGFTNIIPLVGDVTDKDSLTGMAARVREEHGYVNVLFANAGVTGPKLADLVGADVTSTAGAKPNVKDFEAAMMKPSFEEFSAPFVMNCTAVFYTSIAFLDLLDAGNTRATVPQTSQILVTSSVAGFLRTMGVGFAYTASKAGTTHLVKTMALYFGEYKIRCNIIAPGIFPSEMSAGILPNAKMHQGVDGAFEGALELPRHISPAERSGSEQDFASAIIFLCSPAGAYLDGNVLLTDGGRVILSPSGY